jgi:DNA-binding transcriptional ArsR family regulator
MVDAAYRAVADPTRRAILDRLRAGGAPVHEIAAAFDMSRPAVSKHLRVLREARLIGERRAGRERIYHLTPAPLEAVHQWVGTYRAFWAASLTRLKQHIEGEGS